MIRVAIFLVLFLPPLSAWAGKDFGSPAIGSTTAGFLKLGAGARAVSMGEAYSAVADEASGLYWNPATLTRLEGQSITLMHAAYIDSSLFDYAGYGISLRNYGAFGLGVQYFNAGRITQTDTTGTEIGNFTPNDLAVSLGYAYQSKDSELPIVLDGVSMGLAVKFIHSQILTSAQTFTADFGILSPLYADDRLRLAFVIANMGGRIKFEQDSENLPLLIKLGSAYQIRKRWLASLDIGAPRDNNPFVGVGTEYLIPVLDTWSLAGRLGLNSRTIGDVNGLTGISFGLGFILPKFSIDYTFLPFGDLGLTHRISISLKWGEQSNRYSPEIWTPKMNSPPDADKYPETF